MKGTPRTCLAALQQADTTRQEVTDGMKEAIEFHIDGLRLEGEEEWCDGTEGRAETVTVSVRIWAFDVVGKLAGAGVCGRAMIPWHGPWRRKKTPISLFFP